MINEIIITLVSTAIAAALNFLATKTYSYITGSRIDFIWRNKYSNLKSLQAPLEFDELKRRTRIIVIDDEDNFPISLFVSDGYSIEKWDSVSDYGKLESGYYDIIVLDIKGVASHISDDDGLGVLESIKRTNPAQIIIAYSQHSYDLSKARFWEMADETIVKPSDFLKIRTIINELINTQFKPERYIETFERLLQENHISDKERLILEDKLVKVIKGRIRPNWNELLSFAQNRPDLMNQLITIGDTIIKFY